MNRHRYLFTISYNGVGLAGSQKQPSQPTVYGLLEDALLQIFKQSISCVPVGRTDAGVHADVSYCHCDFSFSFDPLNVIASLNQSLLPRGIMVRDIHLVSDAFHACASAESRTYQYFFTADHALPNYLFHSIAVMMQPFQFIPTSDELQSLFVGNRNFYSLCNMSSDVNTYIRSVYFVDLDSYLYDTLFGKQIEIYRFTIRANAFLYKMVRHIVGILLHSMMNFTNMGRLNDYLLVNRPMVYSLAPVQGLHLAEVKYNNVTKVVKV